MERCCEEMIVAGPAVAGQPGASVAAKDTETAVVQTFGCHRVFGRQTVESYTAIEDVRNQVFPPVSALGGVGVKSIPCPATCAYLVRLSKVWSGCSRGREVAQRFELGLMAVARSGVEVEVEIAVDAGAAAAAPRRY